MEDKKTLEMKLVETLRNSIIGKFVRKKDENLVGEINAIGIENSEGIEIEILYRDSGVPKEARQIPFKDFRDYFVGDKPVETGATSTQLIRQGYRTR